MITLATLPQASLQDIFIQARDHLLKQRVQSRRVHPSTNKYVCSYRGESNTMCAVGCFIAEEEYTKAMDNQGNTSFGGLVAQNLFPTVDTKRYELLAKLQLLHDNNEVMLWEYKLLELAIDMNLEWV